MSQIINILDIMPDRELAATKVKEIKKMGKESKENGINWAVL